MDNKTYKAIMSIQIIKMNKDLYKDNKKLFYWKKNNINTKDTI